MVDCPKCGNVLVPIYATESHDFLVGGWCPKCKKTYPLAVADLDGASEFGDA